MVANKACVLLRCRACYGANCSHSPYPADWLRRLVPRARVVRNADEYNIYRGVRDLFLPYSMATLHF